MTFVHKTRSILCTKVVEIFKKCFVDGHVLYVNSLSKTGLFSKNVEKGHSLTVFRSSNIFYYDLIGLNDKSL